VTDLKLPIANAIPALQATLAVGRNAIVVAPPGAGKTTHVPLALLDSPWRGDGRILMLEPRRLATRAAASRMAFLIGQTVGRTIGYRTRLDGAGSAETRIEVITEGLLLRRLQSDPGLDGVAAVILDEIHERSLESDLGLALCLDLQRMLRPDLRLLAMSATVDGARLSGLMGAEVIESAGRMFPVAVEHQPRDIAHIRDLPDAVARAIRTALTPTNEPVAPAARLPALRSASGRRRCTGVCPPSTVRKFWKPNCPTWCWSAPPGGRRRPIYNFRTGHRLARSPLPSRCCKISVRSTPKAASPPSAAKWLGLAGIPGWQR
jgi:DEAD/DEAH box helicase